MELYYTDFEDADALRRNDARLVDAWMRAAAYAAGDDPETLVPRVTKASASARVELELVQ